MKLNLIAVAVVPALLHFAVLPAAGGVVRLDAGQPYPVNLGFRQAGLHNCGTVAMLLAWARRHPGPASSLVRRHGGGFYTVRFPAAGTVGVSPAELEAARRVRLVAPGTTGTWGAVVLTAFAKLKSGSAQRGFKTTEWIYPGEISAALAGDRGRILPIRRLRSPADYHRLGPSVPAPKLHAWLRQLASIPAVAYTNRCIHIWAVLGYDQARRMVRARDPRRATAQWIALEDFRRRFHLVVFTGGSAGHVRMASAKKGRVCGCLSCAAAREAAATDEEP